jgi:hypothetical protein
MIGALLLSFAVGRGAAGQVVSRADMARLRAHARTTPVVIRAGSLRADTLRSAVDSMRLLPGQVIVAEMKDSPPPAVPPSTRRFLPLLFLTEDLHATRALALRPYVEGEPLEFTGAAFRGTVSLALVDTLQPDRTDTLTTPIWFHISTDAGDVNPADVAVRHTSLPPYATVITAASPGDSVRVLVQPALTLSPVATWLAVRRTLVQVVPATARIMGVGLATTELHVSLPAEAGSNRRDVVLSARHGVPQPSVVQLAGGESGVSVIRSSGVGRDTVVATSGPLRSEPLELVYAWPLLFLIASLLGGIVGSLMDAAAVRRRGTTASRRAYVVSGLAAGVFAAVATVIGLNVTGVDLPATSGEAVVFVVAALGAVLGLRGLRNALPGFGRLLEEGPPAVK